MTSIAWWYGCTAHNLLVVGSMSAPKEVSALRQGVHANRISLQPEVYMGTWFVVMNAVYGCTLLYVNMHNDQRYCVKSTE